MRRAFWGFTSHRGPGYLFGGARDEQFAVFIGNLKIYGNQRTRLNRIVSEDGVAEGGKHDEGGTGRSWRLGTADPPPGRKIVAAADEP